MNKRVEAEVSYPLRPSSVQKTVKVFRFKRTKGFYSNFLSLGECSPKQGRMKALPITASGLLWSKLEREGSQ